MQTKAETAEEVILQEPLPYGEVFTIEGSYQKRSFIEWLFNKPKKLKRFITTHNVVS
jgi:hypothetical protein